MVKNTYEITVFREFGFRKTFKIKCDSNITELNDNIREQCDGNLVSFCDMNNNYLHFDRNTIVGINVKEVK